MNHGQRRLRSSSGAVTGASTGGGSSRVAAVASSTPSGIGMAANAAVSCPGGAPASICSPAAISPAAKSAAVCQRRAGSLASAAMTTASSAGWMSGRNCEIGGGGSDRCLSAIETALSPSKGSRPVSIS